MFNFEKHNYQKYKDRLIYHSNYEFNFLEYSWQRDSSPPPPPPPVTPPILKIFLPPQK